MLLDGRNIQKKEIFINHLHLHTYGKKLNAWLWHPWRPLPKLFNPWSLDLRWRLYGFIWKVHLFLEDILYSKIYLRKKLNAWWWCPLCSLPTIVKFVVPGSGFRWDQFGHILKFQINSVIQNMPKKITEGKLGTERNNRTFFNLWIWILKK